MAAKPTVGFSEIAGHAETVNFVGGLDAILEPDGLEIESTDEGIWNCPRRPVGAWQRGIGIGPEVGSGNRHTVSLDVGGIPEIRELGHKAAGQALLHCNLPGIERLVARASRACKIVTVGRNGGRQERLDAVAVHGLEFAPVVIDGAVLVDVGETLVGSAKSVKAGKHDRAVGQRLAVVLPSGDLILGVPAEGEVVVHVPFFVGDMDGRSLKRLIRRRDRPTRLIVKVPMAPPFVVLIKAKQAHRKFLRDEHVIVVRLVALLMPATERRLERGAAAGKIGLFAAQGDEAARLTEAEENRVWPARDLGALHVVEINRDTRIDEITRRAGGRAAHAEIEIAAVGAAASGVVKAGVGVLDVDLNVGRVGKHLLEVGRGDVREKLGRERGDRGRRVL